MTWTRWGHRAAAAVTLGAGAVGMTVGTAAPASARTTQYADWGRTWDVVGNCTNCVRSGARVWAVQRNLQVGGENPGPLDGVYGAQTAQAIKNWQKANGLTVDGIAGWQVYHSMWGGSEPTLSEGNLVDVPRLNYTGYVNAEYVGNYCNFKYQQVSRTDQWQEYRWWVSGGAWQVNQNGNWVTVGYTRDGRFWDSNDCTNG